MELAALTLGPTGFGYQKFRWLVVFYMVPVACFGFSV
jgi:hypothetical protein